MGLIHFGAPEEIVLNLAKRFRLTHFVETGTFLGGTAGWAASHFKTVDTVEASEPIFRKAQGVLKHHANVRLHFGNSVSCLPRLVEELKEPALFWLDSHWCGEETADVGTQCPVLNEIEIINSSRLDHFILIDDCRLFSAPPALPHRLDDWPNLEQIFASLQRQAGRYDITLAEDTILAVPQHAKLWFRNYMQGRAAEFPYVVVNSQRPYAELSLKGHLRQAVQLMFQSLSRTAAPNTRR